MDDVVDQSHCERFICFIKLSYFLEVGPRGWTLLVESPDKLATLTKTNIFTEDAVIQNWAEELKRILLQQTGMKFGKLTTSFFSDCCGYEYARVQVRPHRIPRVLFDMMSKLMPVCGVSDTSRWPTGVNVNYYPDG